MTKLNEFTDGISGLIKRAKVQNPKIGDYIEHYPLNEDLSFRVKFSNGWLNILQEWARDQEVKPDSISEKDINQMANSFEFIESIVNKKVEEIVVENSPIKTVSFWQKILIFFGLK